MVRLCSAVQTSLGGPSKRGEATSAIWAATVAKMASVEGWKSPDLAASCGSLSDFERQLSRHPRIERPTQLEARNRFCLHESA